MSKEIKRGEKMIPPPTPTIEAMRPPRKAIMVIFQIVLDFHLISPAVKL